MLRWCRSSYRVSPGYGVRNAHFIRTRSEAVDASESKDDGSANSTQTQPVATVTAGRSAVHAMHTITPTLYYYDNRFAEEGTRHQPWHPSLLQDQDLLTRLPSSTLAIPTTPQPFPSNAPTKLQLATLNSSASGRPIVAARKRIDPSRRTSVNLLPPSQRAGKLEDGVSLSQLIRYLQPCGLRTTVFSESVLDQLVVLYRSCRSGGSLGGLSEENFVTLVTLCGLYSTSSPLPSIVRLQSNISTPARGDRKLYWNFVMEVMEDRCRTLGGSVTEAERFWRFQGLTHTLTENQTVSKEQSERAVKLITEDYQVLRRTVVEEAFHISYFRTSLASATTFDIPQAASYLCDYLESRNQLSPTFAQILWQFLVQHGEKIPHSTHSRFLAIVPSICCGSASSPSIWPRSTTPQKEPRQFPALLSRHFTSILIRAFHFDITTPALLAWIYEETAAAFDPHQPLTDRWDNLLLLSDAAVSDSNSSPQFRSPAVSPSSKWRALLLISILGDAFEHINLSHPAGTIAIPRLAAQADSLWDSWVQSTCQPLPIELERAVLLTFLNTVLVTGNVNLLDECARYCFTRNLAHASEGDSPRIRQQITRLIVTYIHARGSCKGYYWERLFSDAALLTSGGTRLPDGQIFSALFTRLLPHEFDDAYALYQFASSNNTRLSPNAVLPLAVTLAERQKWSVIIPLLSGKRFSDRQAETILVGALKVFQTSRLEIINARLAEALGRVMHRVYSTIQPSSPSKFPVRYFFRLLISAGHGELAVLIIRNILARDPSFFTQRCVRRWLVQLVQRQLPRQAMILFRLFQPHFTQPQTEDMRRKLLTALVDAGHSSLARKLTNEPSVSPSQSASTFQRSTKEKLLQLLLRSITAAKKARKDGNRTANVTLRARYPRISGRYIRRLALIRATTKPRFNTLQVMSAINADPRVSSASTRTAISILVRHGRFLAARKLFEKATHANAERKELTAMGNIILHGWLYMHQAKKDGGLRRMFGLMEKLEAEYGFKPDRATVNILTKAILAKESRESPSCLRSFFDCFVERGYPMGERWKEPGLGLSSARTDERARSKSVAAPKWTEHLPWAAVDEQPISTPKHVQPLYKMFIKHFHLVGDLEAAQKLVGVLKEEQNADLERREAEGRARRMGIVRKKARERGL